MPDAIFSTEDIVEVNADTITHLKSQAQTAPKRRFRLCLHRSVDEQLHQSVIVFCQDTYNRAHRHPKGKAESYHMIEGELDVLFFDDEGNITRKIEMGDSQSGKTFFYRLGSDAWHVPVPKSEFVVFHETNLGPYIREAAVEYPAWSPDETDISGISAFQKKINENL